MQGEGRGPLQTDVDIGRALHGRALAGGGEGPLQTAVDWAGPCVGGPTQGEGGRPCKLVLTLRLRRAFDLAAEYTYI